MYSKLRNNISLIITVVILANIFLLVNCGSKKKLKENIVVAYIFGNNKDIQLEKIEANKITHINYAFAKIREGVIKKGFKTDGKNLRKLNSLKKENPDLKILISVGGWAWSNNFSDMALTKKSREKFAESAVKFIKKYNIDGIDIDWEYPGLKGKDNVHRPEDKRNFTLLMKELREQLDELEKKTGKHYLNTFAAGALKRYVEHTEMEKVMEYADYVNLMTYDFFVQGADSVTGHHTCLKTNPKSSKKLSANYAVNLFNKAGVPKSQMVLGAAFYGRAWKCRSSQNKGLFQPGQAANIETSYRFIKEKWENKNGFKRYWDSVAEAPYLWNDSTQIFITYDDDKSVRKKCKYILDNDLKGIMFWEYHGDYKHELLNIMDKRLLDN